MPASCFSRFALCGAAAIACAFSAAGAESNDPDLLGAWKGTGADVQWVLNFLPNDTYQARLGDSPTGSRGEYIARGGRFELLEGNQKRSIMSGSYRVEDCSVLLLTLPNGTARMNRRGTIPTGGCGKGKAPTSASVLGSIGQSPANLSTAVTSAQKANTPAVPDSKPAVAVATVQKPKTAMDPDARQSAATAKSGTQKAVQQSAGAAKTSVKAAASEGASAVKSGAVAFWDKAKGLSHTAVEAGGKAARTVGTKAQEAGKAVSKTFKGKAEDTAAQEAGKQAD